MSGWYVHSDGIKSGYVTVIFAPRPRDIYAYLAVGIKAPGMVFRTVDRADRVRTINEMQMEAGIWEQEQRRIAANMAAGPGEPAGYDMLDGGQRIRYNYDTRR